MSHTKQKGHPGKRLAGNSRKGFARHRVMIAAMIAAFCLLSTGPAAAQTHHGSSSKDSGASSLSTIGQTILGDVVPFGDGTARSWVQVDGEGKPTAVGVTLTETALNGLPADVTPGMIWMAEYILSVPSEVSMLPFNHIGVNWNPRGHIPAGIYNVPHFDFHFYTISPEERTRITARGEDLEKCRRAPEASHMPEGYIFAPESEEPGMGGHWVDPLSHEFHGESFTSTFIYGTYDGKVIFYEPMITKAYLESQPDVTMPVKAPQGFAQAGYYPTSYSIRYDAQRKEYTVALEGMTLRQTMASR